MSWILAKKIEMTRIIKGNELIPITLLEIPTVKVVDIKREEKNGYTSIVLWILKKWENVKLEEWKKALNNSKFQIIREFRLASDKDVNVNIWDDISIDALEWIEKVSLTSYSKWKWFAGAMKRWNFHWGRATHGSKFHRALGSIGNRKPRRTHKWKKMHWHMGYDKTTLRWISLELVNKDMNIIWLKWSVPGARNSLVLINF